MRKRSDGKLMGFAKRWHRPNKVGEPTRTPAPLHAERGRAADADKGKQAALTALFEQRGDGFW
jgi:hypothetical protein